MTDDTELDEQGEPMPCHHCGTPIPPDDVDDDTLMVQCRSCGRKFSILEAETEYDLNQADLDNPPDGVSVENYGREHVRITSNLRGWWTIRISIAALVLLAIVVGGLVGSLFRPDLIGIAIWGSLGLVPATYLSLKTLLGKCRVTIEAGTLSVFTGVGFIGRTQSVNWTRVTTVDFEPHGSQRIRLRGSETLLFGKGLDWDREVYIAGVLRKLLAKGAAAS